MIDAHLYLILHFSCVMSDDERLFSLLRSLVEFITLENAMLCIKNASSKSEKNHLEELIEFIQQSLICSIVDVTFLIDQSKNSVRFTLNKAFSANYFRENYCSLEIVVHIPCCQCIRYSSI